ncbi:MAG: DUF1835 domain-containing protein, partial [Bacteroidota bacterium]
MLHVLNGDGTKAGFQESGIPGHQLIWREMLMEGPLKETIDSSFFRLRSDFLNAQYPIEGNQDFYQTQVQSELVKLQSANEYDEIVLWFEYDLFCQVNLWCCLSMLSDFRGTVSLVCPTHHASVEHFKGMGQLAPEHFPPLFQNRLPLTPIDLKCGADLWMAFVQEDRVKLSQIPLSPALLAAKPAIEAHLKRYPEMGQSVSP